MFSSEEQVAGATQIILASGSPRRRELLTSLGFAIEVLPSTYPEPEIKGATPQQIALIHALEKAKDVARLRPDGVILAADTVVDIDGVALGKPRDADHACATLASLAGRWHEVHTGFAILFQDQCIVECSTTAVEMYPLSAQEIAEYVATGDPLDKAGSYGIQGRGAINIAGIRGDYFTVVGLPIARVVRALQKLHIRV